MSKQTKVFCDACGMEIRDPDGIKASFVTNVGTVELSADLHNRACLLKWLEGAGELR